MKILFVTGDTDSAKYIEEEIGIEKAVAMTKANENSLIINNDDIYARLNILEFKEEHSYFLQVIKEECMGYSSDTNFYIINEWKVCF